MTIEKIKIENTCPVCGYEMEAPPANYRICPSCGTEFGVHDVNATIAELRESWLATGAQWWSKVDPIPANWDPIAQLERAGIAVKRQPSSQPSAVSTSTSTVTIGGRNGALKAGVGWTASSSDRGDKSPEVECN